MKSKHFPVGRGRVRLVRRFLAWGLAVGMATAGWAATGEAVTQAMQEALYAEEVKGDVAGALKAYEAVTARFEEQRDLAATALFRQGECLRKLERPQEAAAVYRRVLTLFPDKERLVRLSRENLVALGVSAAEGAGMPTAAAGPAGMSEGEQKEWDRVREMARNSPDLLFAESGNAFLTAASNGHLAVLDWFLREQSAGAKPQLGAAAGMAVQEGQLKACEMLLAAGAPTSGLLVKALQHQRWSVARLLLASKADLTEISWAPVKWLTRATGGDAVRGPVLVVALGMETVVPPDVVADLLKAGADPNAAGVIEGTGEVLTPLSIAVRRGRLDQLTVLLEAKADPNGVVGASGRTPLMRAMEGSTKASEAMVQALATAGADWKMRSPDGWTTLHAAAENGLVFGVEAAIQAGVDANASTEEGVTPLMLAQISYDGYRVVPALLKAGAKADTLHPKLGNALARACRDWPIEETALGALEALLQAGADANKPASFDNGLSMVPLQSALRQWEGAWPSAIEVLLKHGARAQDLGGEFATLADRLRNSLKLNQSAPGPAEAAWSTVFAAFRPLWKASHFDQNERRSRAVWIDDGQVWMEKFRQARTAPPTPRPTFSALIAEDSALIGPPTLIQWVRQWLVVSPGRARHWDRATLTRTDGDREVVLEINVTAIAQGSQSEPEVRWGDVLAVPLKYEKDASDSEVEAWANREKRISLRIDLGEAGVVSHPPGTETLLWEAVTVKTPHIALATVVRQVGLPVDVLNLVVTVRRVGENGALADMPVNWDRPPTLVHGDIVVVSAPEMKPSLSEEAMRSGVWVCASKDGPFWPINAQVGNTGGPPLGYLLLALQAPHPGPFQRVDWSKAVLRSWIPKSDEPQAAGEVREVRDEAGWKDEPLLSVWATARLALGHVLILPEGDGATTELPAALKDGLGQLGFDWDVQVDTLAPVPRSYRPRLFTRRLIGPRTVWSDEREGAISGPVLPLARDLLAMADLLGSDLPSSRDPMANQQVAHVWAEANGRLWFSREAAAARGAQIQLTTPQIQINNGNLNSPQPAAAPPRRRVVLPAPDATK